MKPNLEHQTKIQKKKLWIKVYMKWERHRYMYETIEFKIKDYITKYFPNGIFEFSFCSIILCAFFAQFGVAFI